MFAALCCAVAGQENPAACQVRVTTVPPGAVVSCDRVMQDASPVLIDNLAPGEHLLIATKSGHRQARRTIHLKQGQRIAVELTLPPVHGLLLVHSDPSGAVVHIDGADRGSTPLLLTDLPLGKYRLNVSAQGYLPKEVEVDVGDRSPVKADVKLTSNSARLDISSQPSGAEVTLNGIRTGKTTPCSIDRIPAGPSRIELSFPAYQPLVKELKLSPGQEESVSFVLTPLPSSLSIISIPEGARIYVDNQFRGESPVTLDDIQAGQYRVRAEADGYDAMARTISVPRAEKIVEEFRLQSNAGALQLTTEPAGVSVFIDGKARGVTSVLPGKTDRVSDQLLVDLLSEGSHTLLLTRKGFHDKTVTLQVERGKTVAMHERLRRRFIPDYEVITDKAVHRGVLVVIDPVGNVKLETAPGVFKTIPAGDIKTRRPIRADVSEGVE